MSVAERATFQTWNSSKSPLKHWLFEGLQPIVRIDCAVASAVVPPVPAAVILSWPLT
jgi:hypothetical protein